MRLIWSMVFLFAAGISMTQGVHSVAKHILDAQKQLQANPISLFQADVRINDRSRHSQFIDQYQYLQILPQQVRDLQTQQPEYLKIEMPSDLNIGSLLLYKVQLFADGYQLRTSSGKVNTLEYQNIFYHGIVEGDTQSLAVVSVFGNRVHILISGGHSNYRIHQIEDGQYAFYEEAQLKKQEAFGCLTEDSEAQTGIRPSSTGKGRSVQTGNCVEIYFECDHESYLDNGSSLQNTEMWVSNLFNEVSILYANENVPITISEIFVWDTPDIYQDINSTSGVLSAFKSERNTTGFNGRLAHLLSTRGLGGGIAYVGVLCSNVNNYAVSANLSTNIIPFPNYSWNVNVVAHELGHNFGSPHTHACAWNGNNTQIDDCGNQYWFNNGGNYGSCFDTLNPIIPADGSVMSYCHLSTGNGISFNVGFGQQPGDLIYDRYITSSCNTGTCSPPACVSLSHPQNGATAALIDGDISWESEPGAIGYRITIGTTPTNGSIANNVDVGMTMTYDPGTLPFNTTIYVLVTPYNNLGDAANCTVESFTTEDNTPPTCTSLITPMNGASDISVDQDLFWIPPEGYETGYKLRIGTTQGGSEILANTDIGNTTSYDPGMLPVSTNIFVQITPYGTSGDTEGCFEETFATNNQNVYCASAGQNSSYEWISSFTLGSFIKDSEGQGYSDFTGDTIDLHTGESYQVSITPGFSSQTYQEYYKIWADLNHDGDFTDPGEELFTEGPSSTTVSGSIMIPQETIIGSTRIRVSMKWNSGQTACEAFSYGEVEDYTVRILSGVPCNIVTNTNQSGSGSFFNALECAQPGDTIFFSSGIANQVIDLLETFVVINEPLTLIANPEDQITICGLQTQRVFDVQDGGIAFIQGLNIISGLSPSGSIIQNSGTTVLNNVILSPHPNLVPDAVLIENGGTLEVRGSINISGN